MRDKALFALLVLAWTVALLVVAWLLVGRTSPESVGQMLGYVVSTAVILAARGVPWPRRLGWAAAATALGIVYGGLAKIPPLDSFLGGGAGLSPTDPRAPFVGLYVVVGLALPVLVLVLFVGRKPSMLWSRS